MSLGGGDSATCSTSRCRGEKCSPSPRLRGALEESEVDRAENEVNALLEQVDKLLEILRAIPQFPSEVIIGSIDFARFVNLNVQALTTVAGSLRLVQVGTGYAVPIELLPAEHRGDNDVRSL